jgi:excisionase family DNA binding protein
MSGRQRADLPPPVATAGELREHLAAALHAAMRRPDAEAIALTADRTKAMAVALAGMPDQQPIQLSELGLSVRQTAAVLGFHPEHVRRLIRSGRLRAGRAAGDYRILLDDLWPLVEVRYREPGKRRVRVRR